MATSTIWGAAQSVENLCRGVRLVFTARHGGLLVSKGFAEKHIPQSVLEKIPFRDNYYQFEEDGKLKEIKGYKFIKINVLDQYLNDWHLSMDSHTQ